MDREGKALFTFRMLVSDLMMLGIFAYVIDFNWVNYFKIDIPQSLRLSGLVLGIGALPFIAWVHRILDKQFSPDLELKDNHQLITSGPLPNNSASHVYGFVCLYVGCLPNLS